MFYITKYPVCIAKIELIMNRFKLFMIIAHILSTCQLSLLPSAGQGTSTGHSAVMLCGWGVKA